MTNPLKLADEVLTLEKGSYLGSFECDEFTDRIIEVAPILAQAVIDMAKRIEELEDSLEEYRELLEVESVLRKARKSRTRPDPYFHGEKIG